MSRLRRLHLTGKFFFVTCNMLRTRVKLGDNDFGTLVQAIGKVRARRRFLLAGYVFMPDHWHALIVPARGDSIDLAMNAIKVTSAHAINHRRGTRGTRGSLWLSRYYDRIMRTVKEFLDALDYMHMNPVTAGLVRDPAMWAWSSFHCFGGPRVVPLEVDRLNLPGDESAHL